jgi:uncharacterized membrane protein YbhN (UPF0104 family)
LIKLFPLKKNLIKALKIIIPMGIGIYLTYFFYSGLEPDQKKEIPVAFANANYFWVLLSVLVAWLGHMSRAYRWKFLMEPLGYSPKLSSMYHSTMIGYVLNFTIPRSGEIARPGFLAKKEGLPFDKVFGTVVAERIIDVVMLLTITFSTWALVGKKVIEDLTKRDEASGPPYLLYAILGFGILGILIFIFSKKIRSFVLDKLKGMWEGIKTIFTMKKRIPFILHTLFIWISYVLLMWLMAQGVDGMEDIGIKELMVGFVVGAAAITITPGGIGLYPIFITAALVYFGYDKGLASSFSIMSWVVQTIFLVVAGIYSLYAINIKFSNAEVEDQLEKEEN